MGTAFFDSKAVEVTDTYFVHALELDADNLLALDEDRLLAGFRETAAYIAGMGEEERTCFMKKKERYGGGWENALIGGHTLGHYMTAAAQGAVNPGLPLEKRTALKARLDSIITALCECQDMTKGTGYEGYLFGATLPEKDNPDSQFDHVETGETNIVNQAWVPWYTMHKILAGLIDSYVFTGNKQGLSAANRLAEWVAGRVNAWSEEMRQMVLATEYGGMNDVLYELYKVTDSPKRKEFLKAAHQFDETELFERVLSGEKNCLNGIHANTTIPKFLGALCRYEVDESETRYLAYAKAFFDMVLESYTYITGGNSEDEHFGAAYALQESRTNCNNETCNTYNMLKLSRRLFLITGDKKYADYYEKTLINAILSSQDHKTGRTMYFQPMATGYQKIFGTIDNSFWCCTGSGMENFTKLQDSIYFVKPDAVGVNLYIASRASGDGYVIEQKGDLSTGDTMTFSVSGEAVSFDMLLRIPPWVREGKVTVKFGGECCDLEEDRGYLVIPNEKIASGAVFSVTLPMEVRAENLPDGKNTYAFCYGPFVLSAKLGTDKQTILYHGVSVAVPGKKAVDRDTIGIRSASSVEEFMNQIGSHLVKEPDEMVFTLHGTKEQYIFTPHYNQDEESYGIYWTFYVDEDGRDGEAVLAEKEEKRMEEAVVDKVEQAGRGQYEARFLLPDGITKDGLVDNGSVGEDAPALTRAAYAGGSFGYKMQIDKAEDLQLVLTLAKEDCGKPLHIEIGGEVIADERIGTADANVENRTLAKADEEMYFQKVYPISKETVEAAMSQLTVLEEEKPVGKHIILIGFSGTGTEASARVCKSVLLMRPFREENHLVRLMCDGREIREEDGVYSLTVPYGSTPELSFEIADDGGYLEWNENITDETETKTLVTADVVTEYKLTVYAQNFHPVQSCIVRVKRDYSGFSLDKNVVKKFSLHDSLDGAVPVLQSDDIVPAADMVCRFEEGVQGKALSMDGSFGLLLLSDPSVLGESYTISYWMKPARTGAAYDPTLAGGDFADAYWLNLTLDGKMWSSNGRWVSSASTGAYMAGEWQHVALVVEGDREGSAENTVYGELYVNGRKVNSGNIASGLMTKSGSALYFGINPWDAVYTGGVGEICLFNRSLSEVEVQGIAAREIRM